MRNPRSSSFAEVLALVLLVWGTLCISAPWARATAPDHDDEPDSFDLLGEFPTKELRGRTKSYQLRTSMIYGNLNFSSKSLQSDVAFDGVQAGGRVELEQWFRVGKSQRKSLGLVADLQFLYVGVLNKLPGAPLYYLSQSLQLGWRAIGAGHTLPWTPEVTLMAGPAFELFPAMTVNTKYTGELSYDLNHPLVLGGKVGARIRVPFFSHNLAFEGTGYYIFPFQALGGASGASLGTSDTQSLGATALVDYLLTKGIIAGAGFYMGFFKLNYQLEGAAAAADTRFLTRAFLASLRLNL